MLNFTKLRFSSSIKGLYFPINHRVVDSRVSPKAAEEADVQSRYRRQLRTSFTTGETRQVEVPTWSQRVPPTHFISLPLPIKNSLTPRVKKMQDAMIFANQSMSEVLIPLGKLHVTLGVISIGEEEVSEKLPLVEAVVRDACEALNKKPLKLRFRGLGTFGNNRVLFIRCVPEGNFTSLDRTVQKIRKEIGFGLNIDIKGNPHDSYVPHITVAKVRPHQKSKFNGRLPISAWADFQHMDFGDVAFDKVHICNMKGKGENGYYKIESSVSI